MEADASALPVNVYKDQDFWVPSYRIFVGERELRQEIGDVLSVTYEDSLTEVDSFEIKVNNWREGPLAFHERALKYSDAPTFNPWQDVEVWIGYIREGRDERRRMLLGEITTLSPDFPEAGPSTLTVSGVNLFHRFRTEQITRPFFDKTDTEVADVLVEEIARAARERTPQLRIRLDPEDIERNREREEPVPYLLVNNEYPISFLMDRAGRIGYELSMEELADGDRREVIFHYRPSNDVNRTTYRLEWGVSLLSFTPRLQVGEQVGEVVVKGWNPDTKQPIQVTAGRADMHRHGVLVPDDLSLTEPEPRRREIVTDRPVQNEAEARELATKIMRQISQNLVEARGRTIGVPDLRAGVKVEIEGVGERFSGTYLVTKTSHTVGENGYTTDFSARKEQP